MAVSAAIKFVQGVTTDDPGISVIGVLTTSVVLSNGDNTNVINWTWEVIDKPVGSVLPVGVLAGGNVPTTTFSPDVRGSYLFRLSVVDRAGNQAQDVRCFSVLETTGRLIPPFLGDMASINFSGNKRGWAKYLEAYLHAVDAGGGGGVPTSRQIISGTGLTGGGDLTADRTLNVVANADGSIIANADDIQVGILATDAQHGARGGGTQHAIATTSVNGFMSAGDKVKLDGYPTSPATIFYGNADRAQYTAVNNSGDYSVGLKFFALSSLNFTGARFYAQFLGGGTKSVKVTLYNVTDSLQVDQNTQAGVTSGNFYDVTFSTVALDPSKQYMIYMYVTDGSRYFAFSDPADPSITTTKSFIAGPSYVVYKNTFSAGDAVPLIDTASERYSIQPRLVNP